MRLVTFTRDGAEPRPGALLGEDRIADLSPAFGSLQSLVAAGPGGLETARALAAEPGDGQVHARDDVRLLAPIPRPRKNVFCVGLNFRSHVEQNAEALGMPFEIPDVPLFFSKPVTAVVGPGAPIALDPRLTAKLDYEVELAVIVGRGGTWIGRDAAREHIFGYTLVNDVSARDLQWRTSQFLYGKGLDSYCPMGPAVVTRDELDDVDEVVIELYVNGERRQSERAGNMLFPAEVAIAELSKGITLEAGDVISLGTPGGCGYQMVPPVFLRDGDRVECRADGIGTLTNHVAEVPATEQE